MVPNLHLFLALRYRPGPVVTPADLYAEQQAADAEPAGDDWPDDDPRRHLLHRGRWVPIDDAPSIDNYQPANAKVPGQN